MVSKSIHKWGDVFLNKTDASLKLMFSKSPIRPFNNTISNSCILAAVCTLVINMNSSADSLKKLTPVTSPVLTKTPPPEFTLLDMEDEPNKLSDYKGKLVIVNFWASWCVECRSEIPSMNRAQEKLKDDDVALIGINVGESEETIFRFANKYPIHFRVLRDESAEEAKKWGIIGLPTTFILNAKGHVVYKAIGPREWDDDSLLLEIKNVK